MATDYVKQAQQYWTTHGLPKRKFESWKHTPVGLFQLPQRLEHDAELSATTTSPLFLPLENTLSLSPQLGLEATQSHYNKNKLHYTRHSMKELGPADLYPIDFTQHPLASKALSEQEWIDIFDFTAEQKTSAHLVHVTPSSLKPTMCCGIRLIRVGANTQLTLVEEVQGDISPEVLFNHVTFIDLAQGAELHYISLAKASLNTPTIHGLHVFQASGSQATLHALQLSPQAARQDIDIHLQGEKAQVSVHHTLVAKGTSHHDHHMTVHHHAPHTKSEVDLRAVAADQACCISHAKVIIPAGSIESDASQNLHHLLLSPHARAAAEPQLVVNTDQVKCAHGATVGQLDMQALHYCLSRGISPAIAKKMLIQAFLADRFIGIEQAIIRETLEELLTQTLQY
jgi:hypothetical protein